MKYNINRTLHLLTNRVVFPDNFFITGADIYEPYEESIAVQNIKNILQLNNTDTNYYIFSILSCINNYSYLKKLIDDYNTSYSISDFRLSSSTFELATPISSVKGDFGFNYRNTPYPVIFTYELTYKDSTYISVNGTETFKYGYGENTLYPEWNNSFIYTGGFSLVSDWSPGSYLRINYIPHYYPADKVVELLDSNYDKEKLLLDTGLLNAYLNSKDNYEKVAIVATMLILKNPNF